MENRAVDLFEAFLQPAKGPAHGKFANAFRRQLLHGVHESDGQRQLHRKTHGEIV
jgi:hypothetical protein